MELTPQLEDCLRRFSTPKLTLPRGHDIRRCEKLESLGLLQSEHIEAEAKRVEGGILRTFKRAYRAVSSKEPIREV